VHGVKSVFVGKLSEVLIGWFGLLITQKKEYSKIVIAIIRA
jgi:hypothetical protein